MNTKRSLIIAILGGAGLERREMAGDPWRLGDVQGILAACNFPFAFGGFLHLLACHDTSCRSPPGPALPVLKKIPWSRTAADACHELAGQKPCRRIPWSGCCAHAREWGDQHSTAQKEGLPSWLVSRVSLSAKWTAQCSRRLTSSQLLVEQGESANTV